MCIRCAQVHEGLCKVKAPVCANCKGNHQANYKQCPKRIEKQSVIRKSTEEEISLSEASKIVNSEQKELTNKIEHSNKKVILETKTKTKYVEMTDVVTIVAACLSKYKSFQTSNFTVEKICAFAGMVVKEMYQYEINQDRVIDLVQKCSNLEI